MTFKFPAWLEWYKKPAQVDFEKYAASLKRKFEDHDEIYLAGSRSSVMTNRSSQGIPKRLALTRILNNKTCSPMSLYDFYMYLKYVEFSAENLEFYLWLKDYTKRYNQNSVQHHKVGILSQAEEVIGSEVDLIGDTKDETQLEMGSVSIADSYTTQFTSYIESLPAIEAGYNCTPCSGACAKTSKTDDIRKTIESAEQEIQQIIALFLTPDGPKELNIPPSMRKAAIKKLEQSDSPEAFDEIVNHIYTLIRDCSHRNFVRLGVNNGTFETLCMVTFVGITLTIMGFLSMFLLAFASPKIHQSPRWRGLGAAPFWVIGISFLLAGWRGSCFLLLLFSRRQELPWERKSANESVVPTEEKKKGILKFASKLMIFERKIRVKDVGLRRLQRKVVIQSTLGAVVATIFLEIFFLSLPIWR